MTTCNDCNRPIGIGEADYLDALRRVREAEVDARKLRAELDRLHAELRRPCCMACFEPLEYAETQPEAPAPPSPYAETWGDGDAHLWHYACVCSNEERGTGSPPSIATDAARLGLGEEEKEG